MAASRLVRAQGARAGVRRRTPLVGREREVGRLQRGRRRPRVRPRPRRAPRRRSRDRQDASPRRSSRRSPGSRDVARGPLPLLRRPAGVAVHGDPPRLARRRGRRAGDRPPDEGAREARAAPRRRGRRGARRRSAACCGSVSRPRGDRRGRDGRVPPLAGGARGERRRSSSRSRTSTGRTRRRASSRARARADRPGAGGARPDRGADRRTREGAALRMRALGDFGHRTTELFARPAAGRGRRTSCSPALVGERTSTPARAAGSSGRPRATRSTSRSSRGRSSRARSSRAAARGRSRCGRSELLPPTLENLLVARIDRLPEVRAGSRRSPRRSAARSRSPFSSASRARTSRTASTALLRAEIVREVRRYPEFECAFTHGLLHDAALSTLTLGAQARALRETSPRPSSRSTPDSLDEHLERLAHYHAQAGTSRRRSSTPGAPAPGQPSARATSPPRSRGG